MQKQMYLKRNALAEFSSRYRAPHYNWAKVNGPTIVNAFCLVMHWNWAGQGYLTWYCHIQREWALKDTSTREQVQVVWKGRTDNTWAATYRSWSLLDWVLVVFAYYINMLGQNDWSFFWVVQSIILPITTLFVLSTFFEHLHFSCRGHFWVYWETILPIMSLFTLR